MTNFKKLKKTLAVLLCASMLSSGAPKTKGMSNFRHLVSEFTKERSISILDWVGGSLIAEYFTRLLDYIFGAPKNV